MPNHSIQRMRASHSSHLQFSRHRRLALTADADRWATVIAKGAKPPSISLPFPHRQMIQEAF